MDHRDQAKAIWEALDKMAANDPEEYKKFIEDQMRQAGPQFFSSMMQGAMNMAQKSSGSGSKSPDNLINSLGQMSLQNANGGDQSKKEKNKSKTNNNIKPNSKVPANVTVGQGDTKSSKSEPERIMNNLTDESLLAASAKSLIGSIIPPQCREDDGDNVADLLPQKEMKTEEKKKTPLIEEL